MAEKQAEGLRQRGWPAPGGAPKGRGKGKSRYSPVFKLVCAQWFVVWPGPSSQSSEGPRRPRGPKSPLEVAGSNPVTHPSLISLMGFEANPKRRPVQHVYPESGRHRQRKSMLDGAAMTMPLGIVPVCRTGMAEKQAEGLRQRGWPAPGGAPKGRGKGKS